MFSCPMNSLSGAKNRTSKYLSEVVGGNIFIPMGVCTSKTLTGNPVRGRKKVWASNRLCEDACELTIGMGVIKRFSRVGMIFSQIFLFLFYTQKAKKTGQFLASKTL